MNRKGGWNFSHEKAQTCLSLQQSTVCLDAEQQKAVDGASYEATDSQLQTYLSTPCLAMPGLGPHGGHFSFASWSPVRCGEAAGVGGTCSFLFRLLFGQCLSNGLSYQISSSPHAPRIGIITFFPETPLGSARSSEV